MKTVQFQRRYVIFIILFISQTLVGQESTPKKSPPYQEFDLELNGQYRYFFESPQFEQQEDHFISLAIEPSYFVEWQDGKHLFKFTGFARWEQANTRRTHWDIRELYYQYVQDNWELTIGAKKVFWGVTESAHLVDIINQTDLVESFDGEEKLGQPSIHFSYISSFGTIDFFAMPYFRKLQFPGVEARLRFPVAFERDDIGFQDDLEEYYPSFAVRWSNSIGPFDIGLSHFYGIGREPVFLLDEEDPGLLNIFYPINHQTGLDLQAITGPVLWKLESIARFNDFQEVFALASGMEYTFGNVGGSGLDIGLIAEYLYDNRDELTVSSLDNDLFVGARFAFNDVQSTEILFGGIIDLSRSTRLFSLESSRRIGNSWKVSVEGRVFVNISQEEFLFNYRRDSFAELSWSKFF